MKRARRYESSGGTAVESFEDRERQGDRGTKNERGEFTRGELMSKGAGVLGEHPPRGDGYMGTRPMIRLGVYAEVRFGSGDADDLPSIPTQLKGQRFLSLQVICGDEIRLYIGNPAPFARLAASLGAVSGLPRSGARVVAGGESRLGAAGDDVRIVEGRIDVPCRNRDDRNVPHHHPGACFVEAATVPRGDGFSLMPGF